MCECVCVCVCVYMKESEIPGEREDYVGSCRLYSTPLSYQISQPISHLILPAHCVTSVFKTHWIKWATMRELKQKEKHIKLIK